MRIISGSARGRKLFTPGRGSGISSIRPTSDRVREAVFNILAERIAGSIGLDLFAGTGALGLEALSRGSKEVLFVDASHKSIKLINRNIEICGFSNISSVIRRDLLKSLYFLTKIMPETGFDLIFVDPPYRCRIAAKIVEYIGKLNLLSKEGTLVVEEAATVELNPEIKGLHQLDRRIYGDTAVSFYSLK